MTPREIVAELDKYVVGQAKAKRAVAIALRNRYRRQRLPAEMAEEVAPKNILMIGPTGVGKTEIARRLAKLAHSPFLKVEASKFTEVGYVGRDVESMVRDLVEIARQDGDARSGKGRPRDAPRQAAEERLLDLLLPPSHLASAFGESLTRCRNGARAAASTRERCGSSCATDGSTSKTVEIEVRDRAMPSFEVVQGSSVEEIGINLRDMMPGVFQRQDTPPACARVRGARALHAGRVAEAHRHGRCRAGGDRSRRAGRHHLPRRDRQDLPAREGGHGPDISREGVQRDILPIVEGTTVNTKHGMVRTDHVLFIAAGAFHVSKPSDLIPELQGRFPIRVELEALGRDEFIRILTEPTERAHQAVHRAHGDRRACRLDVHAGSHRPARGARDDGQRSHREHWRAAAAHRHGTTARRSVV